MTKLLPRDDISDLVYYMMGEYEEQKAPVYQPLWRFSASEYASFSDELKRLSKFLSSNTDDFFSLYVKPVDETYAVFIVGG